MFCELYLGELFCEPYRGEATWLRLAQGLLLSPPSLYGDRSMIVYLRVGEITIRAFVLSLEVRECYSLLLSSSSLVD